MEQTTLPEVLQRSRISKTECLSVITEPLTRGYGFRHLWIGYTGSGKTYANVLLIMESQGAHRWTLVADQKSRTTPYDGSEIPNVLALAAVEPDGAGKVQAIIRGPRATKDADDIIDFDLLGKQVWDLSQNDEGVLLAIDELADACQGERVWLKGDSKRAYMRLLYSQGRTNKISIAACSQNVQEIPRAAMSNSDTLGIFRQDRKELGYYSQNRFLDDREIEIVGSLADYEFLFIRRGMESVVCKF